MKNNTIVAASDMNYRWGVWLLIASIRKAGMDEPILIGTFNWTDEWIEDICKFPDVKTVPLPGGDKRSVTCQKPEIMLKADSEFITWIDCDGILSGNCSDRLCGGENEIYLRSRTPSEVLNLYVKERTAGDNPEEVPAPILDIWRRDVGELEEPRRKYGCSAALIGIRASTKPFLQKWRDQMLKVLPSDVGVVAKRNIAYFQTDESVLNSLLLFAQDAPEVTAEYRVDNVAEPHYIHFSFNPKPWLMWNPTAMPHYSRVQEVTEWAAAAGFLPREPRPYTLNRRWKWLSAALAPLAPNIHRAKKLKRKLMG